MKLDPKEITMKNDRKAILRSARADEAAELIEYMKVTAAETRFLLREPEEVTMTVEQEELFIQRMEEAPRAFMMTAVTADGRIIGNCSLSPAGDKSRVLHRCDFAIALYKEYHSLGVGTAMMTEAIETARQCGYEQMELGVVASNHTAIGLYKKMGFSEYGRLPHEMKYKDGSYADLLLMVKAL